MGGRLTTHVLNTAEGCPACNMIIELWRIDTTDTGPVRLKTVRTNADGRTAVPLLADDELQVGIYEIVFEVGNYFATRTQATTTLPFLDRVPVRFGIADPTAHYHVPLLVSPWSYTTYRGS
ncbi:MAG TPA: hydroxyisourate hydrolase [Ktedonobacteraceae bacterium]|nr:hydroxyisourate hydrolase [Ktedonobacteraceae bacterium]